MELSKADKANMILEHLDNVMNINWNFKEMYIKEIVKALNDIQNKENE